MAAKLEELNLYAIAAKGERPTLPGTPEEIGKAADALASGLHPNLSICLRLAFVLGQRVGDVLSLVGANVSKLMDPATSV